MPYRTKSKRREDRVVEKNRILAKAFLASGAFQFDASTLKLRKK